MDDLPMSVIRRWLDAEPQDRGERLDDVIEALRAKAMRSLSGPDFKDVLLLIEARWRRAFKDARGELLVYRTSSNDELTPRVRRIVSEGFEGGWSDLYS